MAWLTVSLIHAVVDSDYSAKSFLEGKIREGPVDGFMSTLVMMRDVIVSEKSRRIESMLIVAQVRPSFP